VYVLCLFIGDVWLKATTRVINYEKEGNVWDEVNEGGGIEG